MQRYVHEYGTTCLHELLQVSLWRGDITHLEVDAVVSSSGYATLAMYEAAGECLKTDLRTREECDTEDAFLTPGMHVTLKVII